MLHDCAGVRIWTEQGSGDHLSPLTESSLPPHPRDKGLDTRGAHSSHMIEAAGFRHRGRRLIQVGGTLPTGRNALSVALAYGTVPIGAQ